MPRQWRRLSFISGLTAGRLATARGRTRTPGRGWSRQSAVIAARANVTSTTPNSSPMHLRAPPSNGDKRAPCRSRLPAGHPPRGVERLGRIDTLAMTTAQLRHLHTPRSTDDILAQLVVTTSRRLDDLHKQFTSLAQRPARRSQPRRSGTRADQLAPHPAEQCPDPRPPGHTPRRRHRAPQGPDPHPPARNHHRHPTAPAAAEQ